MKTVYLNVYLRRFKRFFLFCFFIFWFSFMFLFEFTNSDPRKKALVEYACANNGFKLLKFIFRSKNLEKSGHVNQSLETGLLKFQHQNSRWKIPAWISVLPRWAIEVMFWQKFLSEAVKSQSYHLEISQGISNHFNSDRWVCKIKYFSAIISVVFNFQQNFSFNMYSVAKM